MSKALRKFARDFNEARRNRGKAYIDAYHDAKAKRLRAIAGIAEGKPFLTEPHETVLQKLRRRILPRRHTPVTRKGKLTQKERLVQELFGPKQKGLGMLVIKPSFLESSGKVRAFLKKLGCEILYSKPFVLSKSQLLHLYGDPLSSGARSVFRHFPVHALDLLSGPSRVIVFRHLSPQEYINKSAYMQRLKAEDPEGFKQLMYIVEANIARGVPSQQFFRELFRGEQLRPKPGTLKAELVLPEWKRAGFSDNAVRGRARQIDELGLVEWHARKGKGYGQVALAIFPGVHVPRYDSQFNEARVLLTAKDLKQIKNRAIRQGKNGKGQKN